MEIGNAFKDPPARCEARLTIRLENIRLYSAVICTHKTTQSGHTALCCDTSPEQSCQWSDIQTPFSVQYKS